MKKSITDIIEEAAEAAKAAPEHLQEIAFSKAFDTLAGNLSIQVGEAVSAEKAKSQTGGTTKKKTESSRSLEELDRTAHPEIHHGESGLDNSLRLLKAAREDLRIDGLTATEIARVLTDKFRTRISRQAVSLALNDAGQYVNRYKQGQSVMFQIMGPGEAYLDKKSNSIGMGREKAQQRPGSKKKSNNAKKASKPLKRGSKSLSKASRRMGPDAALRQLYNSEFFSVPRTIGNITGELQHSQGRTYKSREISPVLLRYLRDGNLVRRKNKDNQYEYSRP